MRKKAGVGAIILSNVISKALGDVLSKYTQHFTGRATTSQIRTEAMQRLMEHPELQEIPEQKRLELVKTMVNIAPLTAYHASDVIVNAIKHRYHYGAYAGDVISNIHKTEEALKSYL